MKRAEGYRGLDVYQLAHELAVKVHETTLLLPKHETYEEGAQLRRSSKSVSANIVEGYAMRIYKAEFLHFLHRALASCDESQEHVALLWETRSLTDKKTFEGLARGYSELSAKLTRFIAGVRRHHSTPDYVKASAIGNPESEIQEMGS